MWPVFGGQVIGRPYQGTHVPGAGGVAANWESDNAWDIGVPVGTPVYAVADGTIGSQFGRLGSTNLALQGLRLHLETQKGEAYYAHLSRYASGIHPGARVRAGQVIGYTGSANGVAHLHYAVTPGSALALDKAGRGAPGAGDGGAAAVGSSASSFTSGCASTLVYEAAIVGAFVYALHATGAF